MFKNAKFCTLGTAVFRQFFFARQYRFSGNNLPFGFFSAHTDREMARTCAWILISSECFFYNPIFQRMERNDTDPSACI